MTTPDDLEPTPNPNGCRWCGADEQDHAQRWVPEHRWHGWVEPTPEQRKARMVARRRARHRGEDQDRLAC